MSNKLPGEPSSCGDGSHSPRRIVVPLWNEKQRLADELASRYPHSPAGLLSTDDQWDAWLISTGVPTNVGPADNWANGSQLKQQEK